MLKFSFVSQKRILRKGVTEICHTFIFSNLNIFLMIFFDQFALFNFWDWWHFDLASLLQLLMKKAFCISIIFNTSNCILYNLYKESQFHQHFTGSFCADILYPKNYIAKLEKSCAKHFWTKNCLYNVGEIDTSGWKFTKLLKQICNIFCNFLMV